MIFVVKNLHDFWYVQIEFVFEKVKLNWAQEHAGRWGRGCTPAFFKKLFIPGLY
jgi:hypothetical protein